MQVGRIIGAVVSTQKDHRLNGLKLHVVQQTDLMGKPSGGQIVAIDAVGAGEGELILYATGSSARQTEVTQNRPIDAVIMSIVDSITIKGEMVYAKERDE